MAKMTPQDWIEEIERGLSYRNSFGQEHSWRSNELNFVHDPRSSTSIGPNLVFEMGDTILSPIGSLNPEIIVIPEHPAGVERGPIVEAEDNYLIRKMKLRKQVVRACRHSFLYHRAILKIGYDSEFGWSPRLDVGSREDPFGASLSQFNPRTGARIESMRATPGMPWVAAVLPHDIAVPYGTVDLDDDCPWIAHRVIRETKSIKADPKYKNTSSLKPNMSIEEFIGSYLNPGVDRGKGRVQKATERGSPRPHTIYNELWEIHDLRDMTVKVVCKDHEFYLRDEPNAIALACGMPFVSGTFTEHPRSFWGTPLAYYLKQLQEDQFDISKQSQKQRRISILRFLVAQNFIDENELQKVISGDVGVAGFTKVADNLKDKIMPVPTGNLLDLVLQSERVRQDARSLVGHSRNQAGEFDVGTRRTKGEALLVAQGSMQRQSPRMLVVRDLYTDTMGKVNQVIFTYWRRPRRARVGEKWATFTGDEIAGDYLYDLSLASKRDLSKAERKVEALMLLAHIAPLLEGADSKRMIEFVADAANDPAFERLLGYQRGGQRAEGSMQNAGV